MNILEVRDLKIYFYAEQGIVKAVDGISFDIKKGSTLGLVGESGSGKTVTALSILNLVDPPGKIINGQIKYNGASLLDLDAEKMRMLRGKEISIVFQEPLTALNPVLSIEEQMYEMLLAHRRLSKNGCHKIVIEYLKKVNIPSPQKILKDYPHQLSGGTRQRVMIAMSLLLNPKLIILDEPTTALDVTIQAAILDLLMQLKEEMDLSILFITHDLGIIAEIADDVVILEKGRVVEKAGTLEIFENPKNDYTKRLLNAARFLEVSPL